MATRDAILNRNKLIENLKAKGFSIKQSYRYCRKHGDEIVEFEVSFAIVNKTTLEPILFVICLDPYTRGHGWSKTAFKRIKKLEKVNIPFKHKFDGNMYDLIAIVNKNKEK